MTTLFKNAKILTMSQSTPSLIDGCVGVVGNRIVLVGSSMSQADDFCVEHPAARVIDCSGKLLMPGLINSHSHCSMTLQRGSGDDVELMPWLQNIVWPFEAKQTPDDIEAGARLGIAEMLLSGTTTFVDMYWEEASIASAADEMGIRALLGESCLDGCMELFEQRLPRLVERVKGSERIKAAVAPHAPYSCSPATITRAMELAEQYSLPLITHLAETTFEAQQIRELYDSTPTEYLDGLGFIKPSTILAHGVHLSESDIDILKMRGAHVAHCPQSNMKLSSGVAPVTRLLERGVNVAIATDGVCSNNDVDLLDEMRTASFLQKLSTQSALSLPAYEALKMATLNGAKLLGLEGELGVIAPGALADIIVVDTMQPRYRPHIDLISSMVYSSQGNDVEMVMVDGVLLVENHALIGVDTEALCLDVERRSSAIMKLLGVGGV